MWLMRSIRRPFVQFHAANFSSSAAAVEAERCIREGARNDWKREEVKSIYDSPILDLLFHAVSYLHFLSPQKLSSFSTVRLIDSSFRTGFFFLFFCTFLYCVIAILQAQVHRHAHNFREVQQCTLLSIKTGGCSEDCSYCPQSSRYNTGLKAQKLMNKDVVLEAAQKVQFFNMSYKLLDVCFCYAQL